MSPRSIPNKAIFLDRDGTLISDPGYLNDPELVSFCPGVVDGLKRLAQAGYLLIVVTNQSGIPRGLVQEENVLRIHQRIQDELMDHQIQITEFIYSPHLPESDHPWRKPNAGMLLYAIEKYKIAPEKSWMIGDRDSDVVAGQRAQVATVRIQSLDPSPSQLDPPPHYTAPSFSTAVECILAHESGSEGG